jgi:hypothetical protein
MQGFEVKHSRFQGQREAETHSFVQLIIIKRSHYNSLFTVLLKWKLKLIKLAAMR